MSQLVSTGQITIVDNNDARPITAFITASNGVQQIYSKDESTVTSVPNWATTPNVLTAKVFVGTTAGADNITADLTNKKWSTDLITSIGAGVSFSVAANLDPATTPQRIYYFEGDYTDPITGLVSHVIAQISLSVVKTGTNAVYLLPRGTSAIEQSSTAVKNVAAISIDLIRAAGVDTSGVTYKFYKGNGATQITAADVADYGLKTTAASGVPAGVNTDIGVNLPAAAAWSTFNTLVVNETAVNDMAVIRAEAKDSDGTIYQCYFTVYDVSDPYELKLVSTAGDKLQNGVGSTQVYPLVYSGSSLLTAAQTAAWGFSWFFYDGAAPGNRAGFIDVARTAGVRTITANTAGPGAVLSYSGAAIAFVAGDMVKLVTAAGVAKYYEVASGTTAVNLTLRAATVSTFLNTPWPAASITASQFVGGQLYVCAGTGTSAGVKNTTGSGSTSSITVTGDEIDGKGTILCEANRP